MTDEREEQDLTVHDETLRQRAAQDLEECLPAGTFFVVDVSVFADFDVQVKADNGVYIVTFSIVVGIEETVYKRALAYAVDLIRDNLRWLRPVLTPAPLRAETTFPQIDGLADGNLVAIGATACVYQATEAILQRPVAVKVYKTRTDDTMALAGLEASRQASVHHQIIPRLLNAQGVARERTGLPFLIQEWRRGKPLSDQSSLALFVRLPYCERLRHFREICDAVHRIHSAGITHGDIHGGNILYDPTTNTISLIDLGAGSEKPQPGDHVECRLADVRALGRLFGSTICVPPIPGYLEIAGGVSSARELLELLSSLSLSRTRRHWVTDQEYQSEHALLRYIRMSEWIHLFRQQFDIHTRITFQHNLASHIPIETVFDSSSQRTIMVCGGSYDLISEFSTFCREMIRIFVRDLAFEYRARLSATARPAFGALDEADQSMALEAGKGLSPEQIVSDLERISARLKDPSVQTKLAADDRKAALLLGQLSEMAEAKPTERSQLDVGVYSQTLHMAAAVDWLRAEAIKGRFGNLAAEQIECLDALVPECGSFTDGSVIRRLAAAAQLLGRRPDAVSLEVFSELERRSVDAGDWPAYWFGVFATGLIAYLSSYEDLFIMVPASEQVHHLEVHRCGQFRLAPRHSPPTLTLCGDGSPGAQFIITDPDYDMLDLASVLAFEKAARGLASEHFRCGQFSVLGRVGVGNILGIGDRYGVMLDEDEWERMVRSATSYLLQSHRHRETFRVRLRDQFEDFVKDLRNARYDGRITAGRDLSFECTKILRSLGFITLERFDQGISDSSQISKWIDDRIDVVLGNIERAIASLES